MNLKKDSFEMAQFVKIFSIFTMLVGMALTLMGLSKLGWPDAIPWQRGGFNGFAFFLIGTTLLLVILCHFFRRPLYSSVGLIIFLIGVTSGNVWALIVVVWFCVSSALLGSWALRKIKINDVSWISSFLVGVAFYGLIVGVTAHFPINYPAFFGFLLLIPCLFSLDLLKRLIKSIPQNLHLLTREKVNVVDILISAFALVYVVTAFMPEVGYDALVSHLFVPAHLLHRHEWGFDINIYLWAVMPLFADWVYSIAYLLGGEVSARLINVLFIFVIAYLIQSIVFWMRAPRYGRQISTLIFLASPLVFAEGNSLFVDSVWTAYVVAGLFILFKEINFIRSSPSESNNFLIVAAIFFGTALATKLLTLFIFPIAFILSILSNRGRIKSWSDLKVFYLGFGVLILFSSCAYIYAWYATGNPIFPFYNKFFNSPFYPSENFSDSRWTKGLTWDFLYQITFRSGDYLESLPGVAGFQWLLILLPTICSLFIFRNKKVILTTAVAFSYIAICFHFVSYLRYILPGYALLCCVCGFGFASILKFGRLHAVLISIACIATIFLNILFFPAGLFVYQDFPLKTILSENHRANYLLQRLPLRGAIRLVNELNLDKTPVPIFAAPQAAGINSDVLYVHWHNPNWGSQVQKIDSTTAAAELLIKKNIHFVIIDSLTTNLEIPLKYIKEVTKHIAQYGTVEVRKLDESYRFQRELLLNSSLLSKDDWIFVGNSEYSTASQVARVSVSSPITQIVKVNPDVQYQTRVVAKCMVDTCLGRVQVNWLDASAKLMGTNIKVFQANSQWGIYSMMSTAPKGAAMAEVYGVSHSEDFIEIKQISMSY